MMLQINRYLAIATFIILADALNFSLAHAQTPAPPAPAVSAIQPQASGAALGIAANAAANAMTPEIMILNQIEEELKAKYKKEIYIPPSIQSLVFSPSEQSLLQEARSGFNTQSTPVDNGEQSMPGEEGVSGQPVDDNPGITERSLSLGGIVFLTPDDWTIWLNKRRITAAKLPREAIDMRVYKDFIELRWFDAQTNKIFPIRLRPNQTFNLDAQTFIPG